MSDTGRKSKPSPHSPKPLPAWKKAVFGLFVCGIVLLAIEGLLAIMGVKPVQYATDPYVGFSGRLPLFVREGAMMRTADNKRRIFNHQEFPLKKPKTLTGFFASAVQRLTAIRIPIRHPSVVGCARCFRKPILHVNGS